MENISNHNQKSISMKQILTQITESGPISGVLEDWSTPSDFDQKKTNVTYGNTETKQYGSDTTGALRTCNVILPPNYSEDKEYPVLYLLHGIGGDQDEWIEGNPEIISANLNDLGEAEEMLIVIPNVRARANDSLAPGEDAIRSKNNIAAFDNFINDLRDDLIPFIEETYSVSSSREDNAIAGFSMGAREALFIGFSMLDRFTYIGSFSAAPGLLPAADVDFENQFPGQFQEDEFTVPSGQLPPHLALLCVGNEDWLHQYSVQYHNALLKNDVAHLWYTMPGNHDHGVAKNGLYHFMKMIFKDSYKVI